MVGSNWRSRHTLFLKLESGSSHCNTPATCGGHQLEIMSGGCGLLVDVDVDIGFVHYFLTDEFFNHIFQSDDPNQLRL